MQKVKYLIKTNQILNFKLESLHVKKYGPQYNKGFKMLIA